jgi:outer membrane protein TolC
LIVGALLPGAPAAAQEEELAALGELSGPSIGVAESVDRTLRNSAKVAAAGEQVNNRAGAYQAQQGPFDNKLFLDSELKRLEFELLRPELSGEIRKRLPLEYLGVEGLEKGDPGFLDQAADAIMAGTSTEVTQLFRPCTRLETVVIIEAGDRELTACLAFDGRLVGLELPQDIGIPPTTSLDELLRVLNILGSLSDELSEDIAAQVADFQRLLARDLRDIALLLRISRARLGALPENGQQLEWVTGFGHQWPYRTGSALAVRMDLRSREDNYADKPSGDVGRGDQPFPNSFTAAIGLSYDVALARGRGRIATAGPEMASEAALRAEEQIFLHTAMGEALVTVGSYWNLTAAQQRLDLLVESAERQLRIRNVTQDLIDADELPGSELVRVEGRLAELLSQVATARKAVVEARIGLVSVMGQSVESADMAPLASEPLPGAGLAETDVDVWFDLALQNRRDLEAARQAIRATDILVRSARANLKPRIDLQLNTSYNGIYESFDDRFYDVSGFWEASSGHAAGPSYKIGIKYEVPIKNNRARGRVAKAEAQLSQSRINEWNLRREIRVLLTDLLGSVDRKSEQLVQLQSNLENLQTTLETSRDQYQVGDLSLINLLTTEEQLTNARLGIVAVEQELAILRTRLLFEAGVLLEVPDDLGEDMDPSRLTLGPQVAGASG